MSVYVNVTELRLLAAQLGTSQLRLAAVAERALMEAGEDLRDKWQANATITAGRHGKWYPRSIKARPKGPFAVEVGPTEGMKQAGMSFEFGSRNQPPHLDGQRALDAVMPGLFDKVAAAALEAL